MSPRTLCGIGLATGLLFVACQKKERGNFLGSAVVETETNQIPALMQGPLTWVGKDEGDAVAAGELVALVDTVPYALQYAEAAAGLNELAANLASTSSQIGANQAEVKNWEQESQRLTPLEQAGAATAQQVDRNTNSKVAARYRLRSTQESVRALNAKKQSLSSRLEWLRTQINRCRIQAPVSGFILTRYRNFGEAVSPGQSVFELGRRDSVHVDFFVPQGTLSALKIGDPVHLRVEGESASQSQDVPAQISMIASEAEFTPKNIQTRESRAELVFRVRCVASSRDGLLKRGLPVEVWR